MDSGTVDIRKEKKQPEDRVVRLASILRFGTWALMAAVALMLILLIMWVYLMPTNANGNDFLSSVKVDNFKVSYSLKGLQSGMTLGYKAWVFLYVTAYALWAWFCISRLHLLFGNFKRKKIFITRNTKLLRSFGYALIVGIFLHWVVFAVTFMSIQMGSQGSISDILDMDINFDGSWIIKLIMIGMAFLSAWIMELGCELHTDREYTI